MGILDKIVRVCRGSQMMMIFFLFFSLVFPPSVIISWLASALSEISLPIYGACVRCAPSAQLHERLTNICCLRQIFASYLKASTPIMHAAIEYIWIYSRKVLQHHLCRLFSYSFSNWDKIRRQENEANLLFQAWTNDEISLSISLLTSLGNFYEQMIFH